MMQQETDTLVLLGPRRPQAGQPFAQGGGLDADPEAVVAALREWDYGE